MVNDGVRTYTTYEHTCNEIGNGGSNINKTFEENGENKCRIDLLLMLMRIIISTSVEYSSSHCYQRFEHYRY